MTPRPTEVPRSAKNRGEFCRSNGMSEYFYSHMKERKQSPREMRIGAKVLISAEAEDEWRRAMENPDGPEAAALAEWHRQRANPTTDRGRAAAAAERRLRDRAAAASARAPRVMAARSEA